MTDELRFADIVDQLKQGDRNLSVWFAARCALRALPAFDPEASPMSAFSEIEALAALRCILISAAVSKFETSDGVYLKQMAFAAGARARDLVEEVRTPTSEAIDAAALSVEAVSHAFPYDCGGAAALHARRAIPISNSEEQRDLENPREWNSIWSNSPLIGTAQDIPSFMYQYVGLSDYWSFWRDWYQGFLDGKPLDWELQRRVALIPDADWGKGPEHIARLIEEIKAKFLAEKAPLAETVEFDEDSSKFFTKPLGIENNMLLSTHLGKVEDALDDALNGRNGLMEDSHETRVLRRIFRKYSNDPERVEMDFVDVQNGLSRQMKSGELPESEENRALADTLVNAALDIRATHPEIAENRAVRAKQAIKELPEEARAKFDEALPILESISDEQLAEEFREDFPALLNDATGPVPDHAPRLPGVDPTIRIASRVAKINLLLRSDKIVRKIHESTPYIAVSIVGTIGGLVALLISVL